MGVGLGWVGVVSGVEIGDSDSDAEASGVGAGEAEEGGLWA